MMTRIDPTTTRRLLTGREGLRRRIALEHAALWGRPGFWGDHPVQPRGLVWVRQGQGQLDVFGVGEPDRAVEWLKGLNQPVALIAPRWWEPVVRDHFSKVERSHVETWCLDAGLAWPTYSRVPVKRLSLDDKASFLTAAPSWALNAWASFSGMLLHGAAFGVEHQGAWVALAWVVERSPRNASIGVFVREDLRRIGLGRAVASTLGSYLSQTGAAPIWVVPLSNDPSRKLARALGLRAVMAEALLKARPS